MTQSSIEKAWSDSLIAFEQYHHFLSKLLTDYRGDLMRWLEKMPLSRRDVPLAVVIFDKLNTDEKQLLFPTLVHLASKTVPHVGTVRSIIAALPRDWVLSRLESATEGLLKQADEEECRRILELYSELDKGMLRNLCDRLIRTGTPDVQEVARDFAED